MVLMQLDAKACTLILLGLAVLLVTVGRRRKGRRLPSPRGAWPIVGHLHLLPKERPWVKLKEWADQLGPIYEIKLGLQTVVVLSDYATANALLDKRSAVYSSRPRLVMAGEVISHDQRLTFMPMNNLWKLERKYMNQLTSPTMSATYEPTQDIESTRLLLDYLKRPAKFQTHAQRYAGSLIMSVAFNKHALVASDPNIHDMQAILEELSRSAVPGRYLVDSLPFLNKLPGFLAPWKKEGDHLFKQQKSLFEMHLRDVKKDMANGLEARCFVQQMLSMKDCGLTEEQIAFLAGVMYGAGSDTTSIGITSFTMLMVCYPHVARKAQEELDRVIGRERLPEFADQPELPYVRALVAEVQRYKPIIAGGLAHSTTEDDVYEGYFIAKGTSVIPNSYAIHQDPSLYPEPHVFKPERFLSDEKTFKGVPGADRGHFGFGFGRRACPGSYIADRSLYIVFSRLLWAFNFEYAKDGTGSAIPIDEDAYTTGFSSYPAPFACSITPRFEGVKPILELHASNVGA